jgi:1-deoxy-D-xylulose-5-phosphate synthase
MARILDSIDSPADLKKIPLEKLPGLAQEIRYELIAVASKNGGHLGPNLGVVELCIAMHRAFDTPADNFLFDVSHQAYVHKLLTGRRQRFATIRQPGGLNGFMNREESPHDCFGAGHAGTALSAALGMAKARDLRGSKEHVVALAGDAAFTCGVTYEALNNIATTTRRMIVVLNDNEWSIDKNVGAIANYLNNIVTNENYSYLHERAAKFIERIGGQTAVKMARRAEGVMKGFLLPSVIFEELGLTYYGPVNGHDIPTLIKTFEFLKQQEQPVLLHVLTEKGRGYEPAMVKRKAFHGTPAFDPNTGEATAAGTTPTFSQLLGDQLAKFAADDEKIVAITAGMPNGTGLERFQPKFPGRYFDVGIAEEHAVLFAAGRWCSAWTAAASAATTGRRITGCSTSRTSAACPTRCTCRPRTKTSSLTCCTRRCGIPAPSACAIRAAPAPAPGSRSSRNWCRSASPRRSGPAGRL